MIEARRTVIEQVKTWLGTPFVVKGAVKGAGVDCGSLLIVCYAAAGVLVPSLDGLGHFPLGWNMNTQEERYLNIVKGFAKEVAAPEPGDIAMFKIGPVYAHSAVVVEWPLVIHTMARSRVEYTDASKAPLHKLDKPIFLSPF